ncbi:MAG TPA: hypothetical protein VGD42_13460 [Lysobacter sp.]
MTAYVSYYEVSLEGGVLVARLGSGPAEEIISRSETDPCVRILLQEPSDDSVRFRARCGVAEMTPEGPVRLTQYDPSQQRGAWVRVLPIGTHVLAMLHHAYAIGRLGQAISGGLSSCWLKIDGSDIESTDLSTSYLALTKSTLTTQEAAILVRLGGRPEDVMLVLAQLGAESV